MCYKNYSKIQTYQEEIKMAETLNKKSIAELVAEQHNLTKKEAAEIVDLVQMCIRDRVMNYQL